MSDTERIISAADRIESAAHRMALLFEDGYGGNGVRLLEAMETDIAALRTENAELKLDRDHWKWQALRTEFVIQSRAQVDAAEARARELEGAYKLLHQTEDRLMESNARIRELEAGLMEIVETAPPIDNCIEIAKRLLAEVVKP